MSFDRFQRISITTLAATISLALPLRATEPGPEHKRLPPQLWTPSRNVQVRLPPRPFPSSVAELARLPLSPTLAHAMSASLFPSHPIGSTSDIESATSPAPGVAPGIGRSNLRFAVKPDLTVSDADTTNTSLLDSPHEVTEPAVIESRIFNTHTRAYNYTGYTAFMRFTTPNDIKPLVRIATTSNFVNWSLDTPPISLGDPLPGGSAFNQSGDVQFASQPYQNGLHPYRVYCVGTTFNMTNHRGDTEISVWYTDNAGATWGRYAGINPRVGNPNVYDFDDKPTIAVSWNTSTFGYAYVALTETTTTNQIHVYALNPTTDQWEFRATPVTGFYIQCPRLDVNPTDGTLYLTWLDWQNDTISVATSSDQGVSWSSPSQQTFPSGPLLGPPANDLICSTNCVEARSMLMTRFNKTSSALEVVYHIRQGTAGAAVMENRFASGSWGTPARVSSNLSHDQWNGAVDCAPDGTCVVSYYDFDRQSFSTPITYRLYARHLYTVPAESDTLLYKTTEASDPSRYTLFSNLYYYLGEYQDIWYYDWNGTNFNGIWNAGSVYIQSGDNKGDVRFTRAR